MCSIVYISYTVLTSGEFRIDAAAHITETRVCVIAYTRQAGAVLQFVGTCFVLNMVTFETEFTLYHCAA